MKNIGSSKFHYDNLDFEYSIVLVRICYKQHKHEDYKPSKRECL